MPLYNDNPLTGDTVVPITGSVFVDNPGGGGGGGGSVTQGTVPWIVEQDATPVQVWNAGPVGVTGSFSLGTVPIQVWSEGAVGVSGTVDLGSVPQLQVSNFPAVQAVSGTVTADVAFPANQQVWTEGPVGITGSVSITGTPTVNVGTVPELSIDNFPAVQAISGTVDIGSAPQLQVSNFPATQNVSGSVGISSWGTNVTASVTLAGQGGGGAITVQEASPLQVWSEGAFGVSGTVAISSLPEVSVNNFPATQNVSGTVTANVAFPANQQVWTAGPVGISGTVNLGTVPELSIDNFPLTQNVSGTVVANVTVSGSTGLMVGAPPSAPVWVTGSVALNPTPVITANTATTGTLGLAVGNAGSAPLFVTGSVSLNPTPVITANTATTGTLGLAVGNAGSAPLFVTGTVTINNPSGGGSGGTVTQGTVPWLVQEVTPVQVWSEGNVGVSGTVNIGSAPQLQVSNFPAVQAISGTVTANVTFPTLQQVYSSGTVGVSGSVAAFVQNWPATIGVSASLPLQVWNEGTVGVSGTVSISNSEISVDNFPAVQAVSGTVTVGGYSPGVTGSTYITTTGSLPVVVVGTVNVSQQGQVSVNNFPATQNVSGTVTANVTFPAIQQVWNEGTVGVSGTVSISNSELSIDNFPATQNVSGTVTVGGYAVGVTGSTYITTTGSLPVAVVGTVPVSVAGTVNVSQQGQVSVNNFPATQNVSGTVSISNSELSVDNFPAVQAVSGNVGAFVQNWPATIGVSASVPLQIWSEGPIGVTGSFSIGGEISVDNFPAVQAVSGSQLTGSTFSGFPLVAGGVYYGSGNRGNLPAYVTGIQTDVSGAVYITATGSLPVAVVGTVPVSIGSTVNVSQQGQVSVNNFPATQNVSGTVTANIGTAPQLQVSNFPATQNVSGSITVGAWGTNVTASVTLAGQGGGGAITVQEASPLQVWSEGAFGVSGSVSITSLPQVSVDNFPATQNVSGSVSLVPGAPLQVWSEGNVGVSGSVSVSNFPGQVSINNFPATQNVSGTVTANVTFPTLQQVYSSGTLGVSGTVSIGNWPATIGVSASVPLQVWNEGTVGVSGTVAISSLPQVSVDNFPATQNVSGTVSIGGWGTNVTASIFAAPGAPAWITGSVTINNPASAGTTSNVNIVGATTTLTVQEATPLQVWTEGSFGVSGTVAISSAPQLQVSNFPATQNVSGTVTANVTFPAQLQVYSSGTVGVSGTVSVGNWPATIGVSASVPLQVWSEGALGVSGTVNLGTVPQLQVSNFPAVQAVSGNVGAFVQNWPATIGVSASVPLQIWSEGPIGVTGSFSIGGEISVDNFPAVQAVSGSQLTGSTFSGLPLVMGGVYASSGNAGNLPQYVVGVKADVSGALYVTTTGSLPVAVVGTVPVSIGSTVNVSQQGQVSVNNFPATQNVSGTVTANIGTAPQLQVSNFPAVQAVSGSVALIPGAPLQVWSEGALGVSGSVSITSLPQVQVSNFPATQNVSGTVTANVTFPTLQQVYSSGTVGVSGTVSVGNWPATIGVSASVPLQVWNEGTVGVSGSVSLVPGAPIQVWSEGALGVSGTVAISSLPQVSVDNFPAVQAVSGTVTAAAFIQNWPAVMGVSGTLSVTPAYNNTPQGVTGSQLTGSTFGGYPVVVGGVYASSGNSGNLPEYVVGLKADVSGALYVTTTGSLPVAVVGTVPVSVAGTINTSQQGQISVNNFPATQNVSGTVTANVTFPAIQQVWTEGAFGVSGSVSITSAPQLQISNFPATQNVSGSVTVGGYAPGVTGSIYITATGSIPVAVVGTVPVSIGSTVNVAQQGQVSINNFPATQNVSGTVTANVTFPGIQQVWIEGTQGVSGSVSILSAPQLQVSNFPATQNVSGTVTVGGYTPGVTGSMYITTTGSIPVAVVGTVPVSISSTVNVSQQGQVSVNNFPATQNVSGTVTANVAFPNNQQVWTAGPVGVTGSLSLGLTPVQVWSEGNVGVSGSVSITSLPQVQVSNFPATQNVSGTVTANVTFPAIQQVWIEGTQGISGSVAAFIQNWPATLGVSGSVTATGSVGITNLYQGLPALASGIAQAPPANQVDTFPWTLSLTGSLSASNGQVLPLKSDFQGNLANREQFAPAAEDNYNGVIAVTKLPTTASVYTWAVAGTLTGLTSASQIKSFPGVLRTLNGRIDASAPAGTYFVHVTNTVTGVANGVAQPNVVPPIKAVVADAVDSEFSYDFTSEGAFFSNGCQVALSTTEFTYTAGVGNVMSVGALYR